MYLYRSDEIKIRKGLPEKIMDVMRELDNSYEIGIQNENDINAYMEYAKNLDIVETMTKVYCDDGKISEKDLDIIFKKYGLRV